MECTMDRKNLGIRIDEATLKKIKQVAVFEGRSLSGEIRFLIEQCIKDFEKNNGVIEDSKNE